MKFYYIYYREKNNNTYAYSNYIYLKLFVFTKILTNLFINIMVKIIFIIF
jgi:hypothetical protein